MMAVGCGLIYLLVLPGLENRGWEHGLDFSIWTKKCDKCSTAHVINAKRINIFEFIADVLNQTSWIHRT
jgi:hypothetical protein